jgi:hypothetical protein
MLFRAFKRFGKINRKGSTAFTKVEATYGDQRRMQFFIPVNETIEKFVERVQSQTTDPITYRIDSSYVSTGENNVKTGS